MSRVKQPRNRANRMRIADDHIARELAEWTLPLVLLFAVLTIPRVLGYIAIALGAM